MLALSLNFKFGFFVILCFAHLAGGINLKKGGRKGLVYFRNARLKPSKNDLNLPDVLTANEVFDKRAEQLSVQDFIDLTGKIEEIWEKK